MVVIFLAGAIILVKTNNASDDISLPAEEIHVQDGNGVEQHEFIPLERE